MFRRKDQPNPTHPNALNGRYLKVEPSHRGGYVDYKQGVGYQQRNYFMPSQRGISEKDISESYLSERDEKEINLRKQEIDKLNKSSRRKIPFLLKKKKETGADFTADSNLSSRPSTGEGNEEEDNDEIGEITTYSEGIPIAYENVNTSYLHPSGLNQAIKRLDFDHQYAEEAQKYERMTYIVENYRPPPPYPGNASVDSQEGKSMIQQLLQEKANKQIKDNASMINYCQVDAPKDLSVEDLTKIMRTSSADTSVISSQLHAAVSESGSRLGSYKDLASVTTITSPPRPELRNTLKDDKLVMRTLRSPRAKETLHQISIDLGTLRSKPIDGNELFDSTKMDPSEIYPRDYDFDDDDEVGDLTSSQGLQDSRLTNTSSSVRSEAAPESHLVPLDMPSDRLHQNGSDKAYSVEIIPSYGSNESTRDRDFIAHYVNPQGFRQHPERDYDLPEGPDYEPEAYEPESNGELEGIYIHGYEKSETYVPPSPYMYADIPEWLHVYAKASPNLDELIKWDMFRLPELDCWQTMLKRLYMKELEQVVFWFEEYRQSMQQEMERREREMGIMRIANPVIDQRMKKTDV